MERTSILHLMRAATNRPQVARSPARYLSSLSRQQVATSRTSPFPPTASLAPKRCPAPLQRTFPRSYTTPTNPPITYIPHGAAPAEKQAPTEKNPSAEKKKKDDFNPEQHRSPQSTYQITFTCKPCLHPSTHIITKLSYHYGAVLIQCPNCKNRHVISDHLGIFSDTKLTIEDILKEKGEFVRRGTVTGEGNTEFWDEKEGEGGGRAKELRLPEKDL